MFAYLKLSQRDLLSEYLIKALFKTDVTLDDGTQSEVDRIKKRSKVNFSPWRCCRRDREKELIKRGTLVLGKELDIE